MQRRIESRPLTTSWDVSTVSTTGLISIPFPAPTTADENIYSFEFNPTGTRLYLIARTGPSSPWAAYVRTYALNPAYDITTLQYISSQSTDNFYTIDHQPTTLRFSADGKKMYILGNGTGGSSTDGVRQYRLTTAYNPKSTNILSPEYTYIFPSGLAGSPYSMEWSPDGTFFIYHDYNYGLAKYNLTTPWDLRTAVHDGVPPFILTNPNPPLPKALTSQYAFDMRIILNGTKVVISNYAGNELYTLDSEFTPYSESLSNQGNIISNTVSTTAPFTYSLSEGITFKDSNNDDVMDNPPTINNLPRGLTAVWHLTAGDTKATLELIGQAQDHDIIDNVSLDIIFDNSSVTGGVVPELDCTSSIGTAFFPNPRMRHGKIFSKGGEQNMSFGKRN